MKQVKTKKLGIKTREKIKRKQRKVGKEAETTVACLLSQLNENYVVLNNVLVRTGKESSTQIDHIVVSIYGIFVLETIASCLFQKLPRT